MRSIRIAYIYAMIQYLRHTTSVGKRIVSLFSHTITYTTINITNPIIHRVSICHLCTLCLICIHTRRESASSAVKSPNKNIKSRADKKLKVDSVLAKIRKMWWNDCSYRDRRMWKVEMSIARRACVHERDERDDEGEEKEEEAEKTPPFSTSEVSAAPTVSLLLSSAWKFWLTEREDEKDEERDGERTQRLSHRRTITYDTYSSVTAKKNYYGMDWDERVWCRDGYECNAKRHMHIDVNIISSMRFYDVMRCVMCDVRREMIDMHENTYTHTHKNITHIETRVTHTLTCERTIKVLLKSFQ